MNTMRYNGYAARVEFDAEDHIFTGRLAGINDIVTFHGASVAELEQAFHESVEGYIANCEALGKTPQKPASGRMMLRVDPAVHQSALAAAELAGKSLNQWAGDVLRDAAN